MSRLSTGSCSTPCRAEANLVGVTSTHDDIPALGRHQTLVFTLGQAWRSAPEPELRPTRVEARFADGRLMVDAELVDDDVFNRATRHNQRTWELGDVLEIFVRRDDSEEYTEVHVTPDNLRLHLRFEDFTQVSRIADIDEVAADPESIASTVDRTSRGWRTRVVVPVDAAIGDLLRLSFCRYDATRGREQPVLSSSSPHPELSFHRPLEWRLCRVVD
ncbi:MAG: hypothetical protein U1F36_13465 [Planctomycetota bacterium]